MPSQVYVVKRSFLNFEEGARIVKEDCPQADIPWLLSVGTIVPLSAGPAKMMGAGMPSQNPDDLIADIAELHERHSAMELERDALRAQLDGAKGTVEAAMRLATERARHLAEAVGECGRLTQALAEANRKLAVADSASGGSAPPPAGGLTITTIPPKDVADPLPVAPEPPTDPLPPQVPVTDEAAKTAGGAGAAATVIKRAGKPSR